MKTFLRCENSTCSDKGEQNEEVFSVFKAVMPSGYKYLVCTCTSLRQDNGSDGFNATVRINLSCKDEFKKWRTDYHGSSLTTMRIYRTVKTTGEKVLYHVYLHCQHNTRPRSSTADSRKGSKNTNCPANATVRVYRTNNLSKTLSKSKDPHIHEYPTLISISFSHNHPINVADALKHRDVSDATRNKLEELLLSGYRPSAALNLLKYDLQQNDPDVFESADRSQCPDKQYVYRLAYKLFTTFYGASRTSEEQLLALKEYVDRANKAGTTAERSQGERRSSGQAEPDVMRMEITADHQVVVAICTPMMRRVHQHLKTSGELVFIDASGNMDRSHCRVFVLLTHSVVGGLPLGVVMTTNETHQTIETALKLFNDMLGDSAFYGRGSQGPVVIMTDDAKAERQALKVAYPKATLLLCSFHVLQAFWRFLWDSKNGVPEGERPELFHLLKDILYASTEEEMDNNFRRAEISLLLSKHPKVQRYLVNLYQRKSEWAICCRSSLPIHGNNTNNFVEAAMRVLKDQVLMRTKAFNMVQLADFIVMRMDSYYQRRCIDVANNMTQDHSHSKFLATSKLQQCPQITKLNDTDFEVTSFTNSTIVYTVDMDAGFCSCHMGCTGGPCKHQELVMNRFNIPSRNFIPSCDPKMKQLLHKVATGSDVPLNWFLILRSKSHEQAVDDATEGAVDVEARCAVDVATRGAVDVAIEEAVDVATEAVAADTPQSIHTAWEVVDDDDSGDAFDLTSQDHLLLGQLDKMVEEIRMKFQSNTNAFREPLKQMLKSFSKITTDSHLTSAMTCFGKYSGAALPLSSGRKRLVSSKDIGVQPAAKQRRVLQ